MSPARQTPMPSSVPSGVPSPSRAMSDESAASSNAPIRFLSCRLEVTDGTAAARLVAAASNSVTPGGVTATNRPSGARLRDGPPLADRRVAEHPCFYPCGPFAFCRRIRSQSLPLGKANEPGTTSMRSPVPTPRQFAACARAPETSWSRANENPRHARNQGAPKDMR